jgi:hypothetical protein
LWERVARCERSEQRDEGSASAERDPSSGADCVHATFSHKGRREELTARESRETKKPDLSTGLLIVEF